MNKYTVIFANKEDQCPTFVVIEADSDAIAIEIAEYNPNSCIKGIVPSGSTLIGILEGDVRVVYP